MNLSNTRVLLLICCGLIAACAHLPNAGPQVEDLFQGAPPSDSVRLQTAIMAGELAAKRGLTRQAAEQYAEAAELSPDAAVAARAAQLALSADQDALALKAARRWTALAPEQSQAREITARLALKTGDITLAREHFRAMLDQPADQAAKELVQIAEIIGASALSPDAAWQLLDEISPDAPRLPTDAYARGLLAYRLNDLARARAAIEQARRQQPDERAVSLLALRLHLEDEDLAQARDIIRDLHVATPRDIDLRLLLGRTLLEFGHQDLARKEFSNALKLEPDNVGARYALALIAVDAGLYDRAKGHFETLIEQGARNEDSAYYMGRIAEQQGDPEAAMTWYRQVTRGHRVLDAAIRQAVVMSQQGELAAARTHLEALRGVFPQQELRLLQVEAELLFQTDQIDQAGAVFNRALATYPDDPDLFYGRALVRERRGDIAGAEADLRRILQLDADDARALNALGYILSNHSSRYTEALKYVEKALALSPDDPAVIDSMGWIHYRRGDLDAALDYLRRAYDKMPDAEIAAHLGEVLWQLGQRQEARSIWRQALEADPDHPVLQETVQRLDAPI